jgi:hypothetical protein
MNKFLSKDIAKFPIVIQEIVESVVSELDANPALLKCAVKTLSKDLGRFIFRTSDNSYTVSDPVKDSTSFIKRTSPSVSSVNIVIEFGCLSGNDITSCGWYPDEIGFTTEPPVNSKPISDVLSEEQIASLIKDTEHPLNITRSMFYALSKKTLPNISISFTDNDRTISISENILSTKTGDYILTQYYAKT